MKLCLTCRRLAPVGASFCSECGLAFGGSRCEHGHLTPGRAALRFCPVCRSRTLVPPTRSLELGWLTHVLAWGFALGALRLSLGNLSHILDMADRIIAWFVGEPVVAFLGSVASLLIALMVFAWAVGFVDPATSQRMNPVKTILWLLRTTGKVTVGIARFLWWVVEGKRARSKDSKKGPSNREGSASSRPGGSGGQA